LGWLPEDLPELPELPDVPLGRLGGAFAELPGLAVSAGRSRAMYFLSVAAGSVWAGALTARPGSVRRAEAICPAADGAVDPKSCTSGTAASAPATATAGAALPASRAAFRTCEGDACRPILLSFLFLPCVPAEVTNLPYAGTAPSYSAPCAFRRA
jgi:hypothetical protein